MADQVVVVSPLNSTPVVVGGAGVGPQGPAGVDGNDADLLGVYSSEAALLAAYPVPINSSCWAIVANEFPGIMTVYEPTTVNNVLIWNSTDITTSGGSYTHVQNTPSNQWVITHNLGYKPNVSTVDSAGTQVEGNVSWTSLNGLTITFNGAFSGVAYLS